MTAARTDLFSLTGRVAIVTGASRGIGRAAAETLAQQGATVVIVARDAAALGETARAITEAGGRCETAVADLLDEAAAIDVVAQTVSRHGRLDILVNNAGVLRRGPFVDLEMATWREVLATNLDTAAVLAREAARVMIRANFGRIINISSFVATFPRTQATAYATSKAALSGMTRALAIELGPDVTVNAIAPGYIRTQLTQAAQDNAEFTRFLEQRTAARRWGSVDDLRGVLALLASDASSYITGQTIVVDGGLTAGLIA